MKTPLNYIEIYIVGCQAICSAIFMLPSLLSATNMDRMTNAMQCNAIQDETNINGKRGNSIPISTYRLLSSIMWITEFKRVNCPENLVFISKSIFEIFMMSFHVDLMKSAPKYVSILVEPKKAIESFLI